MEEGAGLQSTSASCKKKPVCLIVLGMAGSGKTSLVTRLTRSENKPYVINLDPACINLPYFANIGRFDVTSKTALHYFFILLDIRDTVNYKEVMKKYKLGPNGAIVTSLNLFSTKFPDVISYIEKAENAYCILDTPGQIEVFTWSVSGNKISDIAYYDNTEISLKIY